MYGKYGPEFGLFSSTPQIATVGGMKLPIRLGQAKIIIVRHDLGNIVDRTGRRRCSAPVSAFAGPLARFGGLLVHQTANGISSGKIDARSTSGTNGYVS